MPQVFISHISQEAGLALVFKEWIETTFAGQVEVFVSADVKDLPAGSKWLSEIDGALDSAAAFLVLCSPQSLHRPWINFESGCAWIKGTPIIPLCHSGQTKAQLPAPFSSFQALDVDSKSLVNDLFVSLAKHFGIGKVPRLDTTTMRNEIDAALKSMPAGAVDVAANGGGAITEAIDENCVKILDLIAKMGDKGYTCDELSGHLGLPSPKGQYYLDMLLKKELLFMNMFTSGDNEYRLSEQGRKFLVENGLL